MTGTQWKKWSGSLQEEGQRFKMCVETHLNPITSYLKLYNIMSHDLGL